MARRTAIARADVKAAESAAAARRNPLVRMLGAASELADQPQLIAICVGTLAIGLVRRDAKLADTGGRMLAAELVATGIKSLIKANVDRTRPYKVADGSPHELKPGHSDDSADNSFPSGHTAGAVAVARAIARTRPERADAAYATAAAVAAIQVPRGKHYPSDLVVGAAIGLAAEALVDAAVRRLDRAVASPK